MAQGLSLHIGLNSVDASKYNGWPGTLAGCVNDANAMQSIAVAQGFTPTQLITQAATADAILGQIGQAAHAMQSGDTFLISYSGHGGRVPDATGTSPDGMDDTWVAYDRMILGHELYNLWSQFPAGVRVEVYSDSCHSGTVIRELVLSGNGPFAKTNGRRGIPASGRNAGMRNFAIVFQSAPNALSKAPRESAVVNIPPRAIPPQLALQRYTQNLQMYETLQWTNKKDVPTATVILISGCQDNQTSQDGTTNGLFTEKLLAVWNNAAFQGTLPQFHEAIVALMPSDQTPNYFSVGPDDATFTNSRPLTIVGSTASSTTTSTTPTTTTTTPTSSGSTPPSISGPASAVDPNGACPSFTIALGSNPYYAVELASDPSLFGNSSARTASTWYATWSDSSETPRRTDTNYTMLQSAFDAIKGNSTLYYRVLSTSSSSPDKWDNYLVSVSDGDAPSQAPSFTVSGAGRDMPVGVGTTTGSKDVPFSSWVGTY